MLTLLLLLEEILHVEEELRDKVVRSRTFSRFAEDTPLADVAVAQLLRNACYHLEANTPGLWSH